jgi:hypothetical protein
MDLWDSPDLNTYQQFYDPYVNELLTLRDGFGSSDGYPPSINYFESDFPSTVEVPRKTIGQLLNTIINMPDGTQRRPIARVPAEVWADILRLSIPSRAENDRTPTLSPRKAPMQLTGITKGLRCIALTMPELWVSISLVPTRDREFPSPETLKYWLRLSQNRPLVISVARSGYPGAGDLEYLFWKLVKWSSERWECLCINPHSIYGDDDRWRRYAFPRLKSLTIQGGIQPSSLPVCFQSLLETSESLEAFSWTCVQPVQFERISELLLNTSLPLSRIQSLNLSIPLRASDALHLLKDAPILEILKFTALKGTRHPSVIMGTYPMQPINLPRLNSLSVNALKFEEEHGQAIRGSLNDFLPYIFTPNLQSLSIGYNDGQCSPFATLQPFFTTTRSLSSLTFSYTPISSEELHGVLAHFTSTGTLKALAIKATPQVASPLSSRLIASMVPSPQCLVPTLQHFSFNVSALNASSPGTVTSMLQRRCDARPQHLRSVHFEDLSLVECRASTPSEISHIRELASRYRLVTTNN